MADTTGYKELSRQLSAMGAAVGGRALRSAAMSAMLPALREAQQRVPVGNPPFESGKDPYPVKTYKGRLRTPGFAKRNIARKSKLSRDKRTVTVMLGMKPEAFYAVQFIEFGTSSIPKAPWLEPAFRASIPDVDARFKEELKKRIDKAAKTK
jgi:HK97 gp10 family phage protein